MWKEELEKIRLKKRKQYLKLMEIMDLTGQLAQAADRRDEVSVKMLISMRQEPLLVLQETEGEIREGLLGMEDGDAIRLSQLLSGAEGTSAEENALHEDIMRNRRLLEKIMELDKRVSMRMGGPRSFYNSFR